MRLRRTEYIPTAMFDQLTPFCPGSRAIGAIVEDESERERVGKRGEFAEERTNRAPLCSVSNFGDFTLSHAVCTCDAVKSATPDWRRQNVTISSNLNSHD
jgi:hypothetical protein